MQTQGYWGLIKQHPNFISFAFLMTLLSSAGQTHFISIFGPAIRLEFALSHTQWSGIYLLGTLLSALALVFTGSWLDRISLRPFAIAVLLGLAVACLSIAISHSIWWLVIAIFLLRQFGQGLCGHTAITSVARYLPKHRGKAIAVSSMGFSVGEAVYPLLGVAAIGWFGWRSSYLAVALLTLGAMALVYFLLRFQDQRDAEYQQHQVSDSTGDDAQAVSKSRADMLSEGRFYLLIPAVMAPSYVVTALFFHHLSIAEIKGWSAYWMTGNYWIYAVFTVLSAIVAGRLVDRFSAAWLIRYYLMPMILGLLALGFGQHKLWLIVYMVLLGLNTGVYFTAISAFWAELYGPKYLGSIKSLAAAVGVFASALGPISIGYLLDLQWSLAMIMLCFVAYCVFATGLLFIALKSFITTP